MIMSLKQREIKFKPRIQLNHNTDIDVVIGVDIDVDFYVRLNRVRFFRVFSVLNRVVWKGRRFSNACSQALKRVPFWTESL